MLIHIMGSLKWSKMPTTSERLKSVWPFAVSLVHANY